MQMQLQPADNTRDGFPVTAWIRAEDRERASLVYPAGFSAYPQDSGLLQFGLPDPGMVARFDDAFTLGRVSMWKIKGSETLPSGAQYARWVRIMNNSLFPEGVALTPYSWINMEYCRHRPPNTTTLHRVELVGSGPAIVRAFMTYESDTLVPKRPNCDGFGHPDHDYHLLIYQSGNFGNRRFLNP